MRDVELALDENPAPSDFDGFTIVRNLQGSCTGRETVDTLKILYKIFSLSDEHLNT